MEIHDVDNDHYELHSSAAAASGEILAGTEATASQDPSSGKHIGAIVLKFYQLFVRHSCEALEHIAIVALVYIVVCLLVYRLIFHTWITHRFHIWTNVRFPQCNRVLIVTAHPDDESMFFAPTILSLSKRSDCRLYLLCLSNGEKSHMFWDRDHISNKSFWSIPNAGNFDNNGRTRQIELWNACRVLNIPKDNITLVNATLLQDDPTVHWKSPIIAKQILKQVHSLDIDVIITFDRDGISHHGNHCAIFYSSVAIFVASLLPDG